MATIINSSSSTIDWLKTIKAEPGIFHTSLFETGQIFTIRSLDMEQDLAIIHEWVNAESAIAYWQLNGSISMLKNVYEKMMGVDYAHSFIGCLNGIPVCQLDAYAPQLDVMGAYYHALETDIGIHLLLGQRNAGIRNFSAKIVNAFATWLFEAAAVERIVAEPDHQNRSANWLLRRLKFEYAGTIDLPEKTACLYIMTKDRFKTVTASG